MAGRRQAGVARYCDSICSVMLHDRATNGCCRRHCADGKVLFGIQSVDTRSCLRDVIAHDVIDRRHLQVLIEGTVWLLGGTGLTDSDHTPDNVNNMYTVSQKNAPTLKSYSSKL